MRIGLDFGGVVVPLAHRRAGGQDATGEDTTIDARGQTTHPGALAGIATLVTRSSGNLWIVSKAGQRMEQRTRAWLDAWDVYDVTGLPRDRVYFCRTRQAKQPICEELAITHFVDDRVHLMQILRGTVPHLYRFAPEEDRHFTPTWATHVSNWPELVESLTGDSGV